MPLKIKMGSIIFEISFPLTAVMTAAVLFDSSLSVIVCFISVLIHEAGHILMLNRFGCIPKKIKLTLFDIAIVDSSKHLRGFRQELAVILAGVISNFLAAGAFLIIYNFFKWKILELFICTNLSLAVFNILPAETLDGGQALMLILCRKYSPEKAMAASDIISLIVLIPLGIVGILVLLRSKYNFSLLLTSLYLLAVLLMKRSSINNSG